jgi:hypothetical protein
MRLSTNLRQQEKDQLLEAYFAIDDQRVRYFFSMMLQSVAAAFAEAKICADAPATQKREKSRNELAA